jgi:tRNA pseudouridine(38-40) synthase
MNDVSPAAGTSQGATTIGLACICEECGESFNSKTKLFKHLQTHGVEGKSSKPVKIALLVGWLTDLSDESDSWKIDQSGISYTDNGEKMENTLWMAIYAVENQLDSISDVPVDFKVERPKGFSRGTSCVQRSLAFLGTEPSSHGCCDTFCFQVKRWLGTDEEWTSKVNSFLPANIRVLHKIVLSAAGSSELHAENSCTQRRYEYMIPLRLVMPPELAKQPDAPIVRRVQTHRTASCDGQRSVEQSMDRDWPHDSPEGQARVHFFRTLKKVLKTFAGRRSFHNFASGGACPEEATAVRRVDRLYHKEIISVSGEMWVIFSVSADAMLRGQVRRMIGLSIALLRGWLPEEYLQVALSQSLVAEIPSVPGWGMYVAECRYAFWEAKFPDEKLDPRRVDGGDASKITAWNRVVLEHIAKLNQQVGDGWLVAFEAHCKEVSNRHFSLELLRLRSTDELNAKFVTQFSQKFIGTHRQTSAAVVDEEVCPEDSSSVSELVSADKVQEVVVPPSSLHDPADEYRHSSRYEDVNLTAGGEAVSSEAQGLYKDVLRLLHEAEASEQWPLSSTGRQKVIEGDTLVENGGFGGSFSVGCLPKHLSQPKGNLLFPGEPPLYFAILCLTHWFRTYEGMFQARDVLVSQPYTLIDYRHQQTCAVPATQRQWRRQRPIHQSNCGTG